MTSVSLWQKPCYLIQNSLDHDLKATNFPRPTGYIKSLLAYVIDLQNTVKIPKILVCLMCALRIRKSIRFWKQYLRANGFMSSLLYEMSRWVCPTSSQPEINSFPSFIWTKWWRPKITQKLGEQLSWKRFIETMTCQRLVSVDNFKLILLSTQINIYCLIANQMPALLVQRAQWTWAAVMLVQSLYFSLPLRLGL